MARQSTTPVMFNRTRRPDNGVNMTTGRAGVVVPLNYIPILRGDSASGRVGVDIELAEMPRPLLNGVTVNLQAWFVPKSIHPQFGGLDSFRASYNEDTIRTKDATYTPADFYERPYSVAAYKDTPIFRTLGIHAGSDTPHTDLIDAYNLIWNFRAAAHSSRIPRRDYVTELSSNIGELAPAFWPTGPLSSFVPDYDRALVLGELDFDTAAGRIPVKNLYVNDAGGQVSASTRQLVYNEATRLYEPSDALAGGNTRELRAAVNSAETGPAADVRSIYADMASGNFTASLADIDKARLTKNFASLRQAYAGNDTTGFDNDDAIVADLMQGFRVEDDAFQRPWLLDSKILQVGFGERFATDAANLDKSVTQGVTSGSLSINLPVSDTGGVIMITMEMLPERFNEAAQDPWLSFKTPSDLPNALRDIQRTEPVDLVQTGRVDVRVAQFDQLYGYEPMNNKWNRNFTRLGGAFYQDNIADPYIEARAAIWNANIIDPEFTENHYIAPDDFPHDVFADEEADAFQVVCRHSLAVTGLTQIGDVLQEDNGEYDSTGSGAFDYLGDIADYYS